jgi:hypothetical protein
MGCGCKKRNQPVTNQTVNVQLTEGTSTPPQEVVIMEQQIEQIIKKVQEINNQEGEETTGVE